MSAPAADSTSDDPRMHRRAILGDAIGLGVGTGVYAISFGALSVAAGLSVWQTSALSLFMFTGASQFALIAVVASGGGALVAVLTAWLIGTRNAFYGLSMNALLRPRGLRRFAQAQFTIDESTGMAIAHEERPDSARLAFWATSISLFILWNLGTLVGAIGAGLIPDPNVLGLDAAAPAAFLALVWPRLTTAAMRWVAAISLLVAVAVAPLLRPGLPVLVAGCIGVGLGLALGVGRERGDS